MRIIYTTASLDPAAGGPARSVPQLALAMARWGHEVALWADEGSALPDGVESGGIDLLTGNFADALANFGPVDIVHDNGLWLPCHQAVAQVCQQQGIKRVVATRGMLEPWALEHKKWKKRLAWWLYQRRNLRGAAGLHATADQEKLQLQSLGLTAPILIAANGVNIPSFEDFTPVKKLATKTALFLGRVHSIKGLPMLVQAWSVLKPKGWRMQIVGPDEDGHRTEIEALVNKAGLADCWSFQDSYEGDAKWQAMRDADLFVLPSFSENFGIVVAESLACGTPVITTTGTPWQGLLEQNCGWWVKPEAAEIQAALAEATQQADTERSAMGQRGRSWVVQEFGWEKIAGEVEGFYQEILAT